MAADTSVGHVPTARASAPVATKQDTDPARRTVPRSGLLALGGTLAGVLNYLLSLLLTHHLEPAAYSAYSGAQGILLVNGVVGGAGVTWVVAQQVAADPSPTGLRRAVTFGTFANGVLGVVSGAVSAVVAASFAGPAAGLVVGASVTVLAVGSTGLGVRQGEGRTASIGGVFLLEALVKIVVAIGLVALAGTGVVGALLGGLAAAFVLLFASWPYRRMVGPPRLLADTGAAWRSALRFTSLQAVVGLFAALDSVAAVALTHQPADAGLYQAASSLGRSLLFVASAVGVAVFPLLQGRDAERHRFHALQTFGLVAVCGSVLLLTLPRDVLLLVFPVEYAGLLRWLPWTTVLGVTLGFQSLLLTFLQGERHSRRVGVLVTTCVVVVVLVTCGATLRWGVVGTAAGSSLSMAAATVALACLPQVRSGVLHALRAAATVRFLLPTAVTTAALVLLRPWPAWWLVVGVLYGLASCTLAFPEVQNLLTRFLPPSTGRHRAVPGHAPAPSTPQEMR